MSADGAEVNINWGELRKRMLEYDRLWKDADDALYALCRTHPDHTSLGGTNAKLMLIGRGYASGIERSVRGAGAIDRAAAFLYARAGEVDAIIASLDGLGEPLTVEALPRILDAHGRFCDLLKGLTRDGLAARSFVSKYLHVHRPLVPVFDSIASERIPKLVPWRSGFPVVRRETWHDDVYFEFLMRFWALYTAAQSNGLGDLLTVKRLDYPLWAPTQGQV